MVGGCPPGHPRIHGCGQPAVVSPGLGGSRPRSAVASPNCVTDGSGGPKKEVEAQQANHSQDSFIARLPARQAYMLTAPENTTYLTGNKTNLTNTPPWRWKARVPAYQHELATMGHGCRPPPRVVPPFPFLPPSSACSLALP